MTFSCIVIDDDPFAVEQLEEYIKKMPLLSLAKTYTNPLLALKDLQTLADPIDFLFTDIEMPELSGLELVKQIPNKIKSLVLVSGYLDYAIDGYHVNAKDFLPKPYDFKKFERTVNRLVNQVKAENPYFYIKSGKNLALKVKVSDIIAIEGNGNYINIHTVNEIFAPYYKLSVIEQELKSYGIFKRISKSFIISTLHIEKRQGYELFLKSNINVIVSESFRKGLNLDF